MTSDLFDSTELESIPIPDGQLEYLHSFLSHEKANQYLQEFITNTPWRHEKVLVWGKQHIQPRLVAWYGDQGSDYSYSGINLKSLPWTNPLFEIKHSLEDIIHYKFRV